MVHYDISTFTFWFYSKQEKFLYPWRTYRRIRDCKSLSGPSLFKFILDTVHFTGPVIFDSLTRNITFSFHCSEQYNIVFWQRLFFTIITLSMRLLFHRVVPQAYYIMESQGKAHTYPWWQFNSARSSHQGAYNPQKLWLQPLSQQDVLEDMVLSSLRTGYLYGTHYSSF